MTNNTTVTKLETVLLFALGMVIFLSKPAIYLLCLLLLGLNVFRLLANRVYRQEVFSRKLFWASTGLFVLGVVATAVGSSYPEDVGWIAKKTMLLPMVVPLLIAFTNPANRIAGMSGVLLGFWIAFVLTGHMYNWSWSGGRYEGATWDVGMWGVLCAMLMVLVTPVLFHHKLAWPWRILMSITFIAAAIMLTTTGSRGPMLGAAAGVFVYLAFQQRKALIGLLAVGAIAIYGMAFVWPLQIAAFKDRALSVTNTQTDASNYIRLALWESGLAQIQHQLINGDRGFWLGNGHTGHEEKSTAFYMDFSANAKVKPGLLLDISPTDEDFIKDFHNMYIQSAIVTGIPWTVGSLLLLMWLISTKGKSKNIFKVSWSSTPTIINYLSIGITYAILPHFAFLIVIFLLCLIYETE